MSFIEDYIDKQDWSEETSPEENWEIGIHIDREGNEHKLSEMTPQYLQNTINFFEGVYDVSKLKAELHSRLQGKNQ